MEISEAFWTFTLQGSVVHKLDFLWKEILLKGKHLIDQSKVDKALVQEDSAKTIGQGNQEVGWIVRRPRSKQDKVRNWTVYTAAAETACKWGPSCPSQGALYMLPAEPGAEDEAPHLDNPLFSSSRRVVGRKVSVAGVGSEPIQCFYVTEYLCK